MASSWRQDFPIPSGEDSYVTRREFAKFMGLTSLAFFAGTFASAMRKLVLRFKGTSSTSVAVAGIEEIPVGGYKLFRYPSENDPCILLRLAEEKFVAFDQRCTHLSCPVFFNAARSQLVCPCHEGFFSVEDGRPLAGPPKRALPQLTVTTSDAQVWITPSGSHGEGSRELIPSLQGGVDATSSNYREASALGADGVVRHKSGWLVPDHPDCGFAAVAPPHEEGIGGDADS